MAFGMRPVGHAGQSYSGRVRKYYVPSSYDTAIYVGDCVIKVGDSNDNEVRTESGVYAPSTLSEVNLATVGDGNLITGVVVGIELAPRVVNGAKYKPASTEAVLSVCDDINAVFEIEANAALTADAIGLNAVLIGSGGSTATGLSSVGLNNTTDVPANDPSNQLLIIGLSPRVGNAIDSDNPILLVKINGHTENTAGTAGAAGIE